MTSISSLIYSGYSHSASRSLSDADDSGGAEVKTTAETDAEADPITRALEEAEAVGDELATQWAQARAKAKLVYQLITGGDMDRDEKQDLVTNMLLTAYDQLHEADDDSVRLEDMPGYAAALAQFAEQNGVSSLFSFTA